MPRVMMRCTDDWDKEFFTGVDRPRKEGLKGLGNKVVECPRCGNPHYLRRLYFEGDKVEPGPLIDIYALDVAYGAAGEIGVLIGCMAMIELYFPELLAKLTNMTLDDAKITTGTFFNFSHRIDLIELITESRPKSEMKSDFLILCKKIRKANNVRLKYAHARYSVAHEKIHVEPFFGDTRKKPKFEFLTVDDISDDLEVVKSAVRAIHQFLYRGKRPTR